MTNHQNFSKTAPHVRSKVSAKKKSMNVTTGKINNISGKVSSRTDRSQKGGAPVLLIENRFFRPGGIRVGTIENMMFRPGLAPDHNSPPPAFRRTTRVTTIPYSKGREYVKTRGIDKLASSTKYEKGKKLHDHTQRNLIKMFGGDAEKISKQMNQSIQKNKSPRNERTNRIPEEGGRATKIKNGKEHKARRPRSRHNWDRLAIEVSAGTITGSHSGCSVPTYLL